jgi:hypothetical protein
VNVAVIGCGPSSLAAAWAAIGLGCKVTIFAPKVKSKIRGAVLLHEPIPGITDTQPEAYVPQIVIGGDIDDYGRKVYGSDYVPRGAAYGDPFRKGFHTWSVPMQYDRLWDRFKDAILDAEVDMQMLSKLIDRYDLVINTAPATQFCAFKNEHVFHSSAIDLTWELMYPGQVDNTIVYSADPEDDWARSSSIFGSVVTEWVGGKAPEGAHRIWKPTGTTCDCFPQVFRTGRFGAWSNLQWIETAYYGTRERILNV